MTYGQVILILFVVLIGYYGFLIFMDIQHLKAAEAAAQENQSEEEIDITDEARSFQPQQVTRDDKKKKEEKKQEEAGNENDSNTDKQQTTSDEQPNEILERRGLPSGGYAWNVEDDDTKNVRLIDGLWTISQRNKLIYSQKAGN